MHRPAAIPTGEIDFCLKHFGIWDCMLIGKGVNMRAIQTVCGEKVCGKTSLEKSTDKSPAEKSQRKIGKREIAKMEELR